MLQLVLITPDRVKGGTYYPITVKKHLRAQAIAQENREWSSVLVLTCVQSMQIIDSGLSVLIREHTRAVTHQ